MVKTVKRPKQQGGLEMVLKVGSVDGANCYFRKLWIFGICDHEISDIQ